MGTLYIICIWLTAWSWWRKLRNKMYVRTLVEWSIMGVGYTVMATLTEAFAVLIMALATGYVYQKVLRHYAKSD
jgi:hypothetical protein